jgi:hypothetical protein
MFFPTAKQTSGLQTGEDFEKDVAKKERKQGTLDIGSPTSDRVRPIFDACPQ